MLILATRVVDSAQKGSDNPGKPSPEVGQDLADVVATAAKHGKRGSPIVPLTGSRDTRPSVFMWLIPASMALRRLRSASSFGVRP